MLKSFEELRGRVSADTSKTIVVAAAHEEHTLDALYSAAKQLPIHYILVGNREKINNISSKLGQTPAADTIVDAEDNADCAAKAVELIRAGRGDVLMKGILETGTLLRAALNKDTGIRDSGIMSHFIFLQVPNYHKLIGVTDGGMTPHPTLEQKADIVRNTAQFYKRLGISQIKVAALCASETVSPKIQETVDAAELQAMCERGELGSGCLLEGPLSFDIAISRESAEIKGHPSVISGDTDVLLVPNITVGNALAKGLTYWGGAIMAGCILGAKVPIILISRASTTEEKFYSIMMCC